MNTIAQEHQPSKNNTPQRRRIGDRRDGRLLRDIDSMHFVMPLIYPNRCDNEAFISERIDLTKTNAWLARKNAANPEFRYTLFHIIVTAAIRTIAERPKMNRFIANKNLYQRDEVSAAFVVKKQFTDESHEGLAFVRAGEHTDIETVRADILRQVHGLKGGASDASSDTMDMFLKMPRFLAKFLIAIACVLDRHGKMPASMIATDPYYASVVLSNLGSIGLKSGYHHLTNWGTTSIFVTVGKIGKNPVTTPDGETELRDSVDIGLTVDERIADGHYYSGTVKLLKYLIENPENLE